MDLIIVLENFGLNEKEARVYLAGLEMGSASAGEIASKCKLPRTFVYDLLDKLISLGLTSYVISEKKKYFTMCAPKELLHILNSKKRMLEDALPDLELLKSYNTLKRPKVEIYDGKESLKSLLDRLINLPEKEMLVYGGSKSFYDLDPYFIESWHRRRVKNKIRMKRIFDDTKETRERMNNFSKSMNLTEYRFLPTKVSAPTPTIIVGGNLALFHLEKTNHYAVLIEDIHMANNYSTFFDMLWKTASNKYLVDNNQNKIKQNKKPIN